MPRTNSTLVEDCLQDDFGLRADGTKPTLATPIATANAIVNQYVADVAAKGLVALSAPVLELIERWLAGFYYTASDPTYVSRSTEGASGSFLRDEGKNPYKQAALDLDPYGLLNALLSRQRAGAIWLGKPAANDLTWEQRN